MKGRRNGMAVRGRKVGRGEGKGSERARAMMILRWRRRRKAIIVEEFITVNGVASKSRSSGIGDRFAGGVEKGSGVSHIS